MRNFTFFILFCLINFSSVYGDNPVKKNMDDSEQVSELLIRKLEEKTSLSSTQRPQLKEAIKMYEDSRKKTFAEAEDNSQDVDFLSLLEIYKTYKEREGEILTEHQHKELYNQQNLRIKKEGLSESKSAAIKTSMDYNQRNIVYKETIKTPGTVYLPYFECIDTFEDIAYYVDFGEACNITINWEVDLAPIGSDIVEIYEVSDKDNWGDCIQVIQGVNKGNIDTQTFNGRVMVLISAGILDGNTNRKGVYLTFSPKLEALGNFSVQGVSHFGGNVGIKTKALPVEALEVGGSIQTTKLKVQSPSGNLVLDVPSSSYAGFNTDRSYFRFEKPLRIARGIFGSAGSYDLSLQTNGTTRVTIVHPSGNMGIGTDKPSEALEVKGRIKLHTINPDESQNDFSLSVDNTSYAFFNTTSGCFLFNQPVLALHGEFGTYGNTNLSLQTCGDTKMTILDSNGNVGIGVPVPSSKLHVQGDILLSRRLGTFGSNNLQLHTNGTTQVTILNSNGNVGIGVPVPEYKLDVNGTIRADEILIKTDGADFVFQEGYSLRSLHEVEQHISEKKHLPEIPSAVEMQEKGVGMAELQIKLLQKIEELTLYVIEQQKLIDMLMEDKRQKKSAL